MDGLPATIHVGQKYPILTAGYFGPSNFSNGNAVVPPPAFTFEDLGLSVKATPHSHLHDEVSVTLEAEFKLLTGTSSNGIPVISNRSLKSETRMKFGEWAVIAGLMQVQDARTIAGIAGLASVPLLGPLMRNTNTDKQSDKVILMLRPTLLAAPPEQVVTHVFRMGSETKPLTPL
jgi:general secretion pathway protein D